MEQRANQPGADAGREATTQQSRPPATQSPQQGKAITAEESRDPSAQVEDRDVIADEAQTIGRHDPDRAVIDGDFYGGDL